MNDFTSPRRGFTLWQLALVLAVLGILAAALIPIINRTAMESGHYGSCQSNLKQIMLGVKQYVQDYDEKYPLVVTVPPNVGWADGVQPYLKSTQIFQCPQEKTAGQSDPSRLGYTDYWLNARLAGKDESKFENQSETIALGDGNDGSESTDATYHLFSLPGRWMGGKKSPLYRHDGGANIAFADGHVKNVRADAWKNGLETTQGYSFLPKIGR